MDTWELLTRELKFYGIDLIDSKHCVVYFEKGVPSRQAIIKTLRQINASVKSKKKLLRNLWTQVEELLQAQQEGLSIVDETMVKLFVFSLKDLLNYLMCFEECDDCRFQVAISNSLNRDIQSFTREQIYSLPEYKIAIDWATRLIMRLIYIRRLLALAMTGRKNISHYDIKTARGVAGPWSHLDLPMEERVFPFGQELKEREQDKQRQRRYQQGLQNYNNDGRVGEGYYWRDLANEPFSWYDRNTEDPYPSRHNLSRWP